MLGGLQWLQKQMPNAHSHQNVTPLYSLIQQLVTSIKAYAQEDSVATWAEYILFHPSAGLRQLIESWVEHNKHSLECQLLATLLTFPTNTQARLYLRLRKHILRLTNEQALEDITLTHQDTITVIHRMFPALQRPHLVTGLKNIFIGYRVSDAKIYACVFIEYMLSIGAPSVSTSKSTSEIITSPNLSDFSSISTFNSAIHRENGLYRKHEHNDIPYKVIESKFTPQKIERKGTNFSGSDRAEHYYYSNSVTYMEEQSGQNDELEDKQNSSSYASRDMPQAYPICGCSRQTNKNIKIQQPNSSHRDSDVLQNITNRSREYDLLISRNADFKKRILTTRQGEGTKTEESILEAINVIHNSIVRNARSGHYL